MQGPILKCVSVGIHLLNVVWHEKHLCVGLVGLVFPKILVFSFPAVKGVKGLTEIAESFLLIQLVLIKTQKYLKDK